MKETIKLGLILFIITAVSAGVLALSNYITAPVIAEIERQGSFGALGEIFPEANDFQPIDEGKLSEIQADNIFVIEVNQALNDEELIGYAIKARSGGYGGEMFTIVGINIDGTIAGIKVVEHSETPGLGSKVEGEDFTNSFVGKSTANEIVAVGAPSADNEVLLLSGATVSTDGVLYGVNGARDAFVNFLAN